jgi:hypothetical protein
MKVFGIVLGIVITLLVAMVGVGYWWWSNNQAVIEQQVADAAEMAKKIAAESDSYGCIAHLKQQVQQCPGLTCQVGLRIFMMECLARAPMASGFCDGVPSSDEMIASAQWSLKQCADTKDAINACVQAMNAVPEFCDSRKDS